MYEIAGGDMCATMGPSFTFGNHAQVEFNCGEERKVVHVYWLKEPWRFVNYRSPLYAFYVLEKQKDS